MATTQIKIPKAPKAVALTLPKGARQNQRYTDPTTGGKYQYLGGAWKTVLAPKSPGLSSSDASGATIATPPAAPPAPTVPYDYSAGFAADPRYATGLASNAAAQNRISTEYGLVINRDTTAGSPTRGQPYWRKPAIGADGKPVLNSAGKPTYESENIIGIIDPTTGNTVYKDSTGKVYPVAGLELDVRPLASGEAGYLGGALGNAAATSANSQQTIAENASQAGARRSGMRASVSLAEVGALQGALARLGLGAGSAFGAEADKLAQLLSAVQGDQTDKAAALASAGTTAPAPEAPAAPASPTTTSGSGWATPGLPTSGALTPGPEGQFMSLLGDATLERNTTDAAIRQNLRRFLNNPAYQLTAQQKAYINSLIAGRYKGNKRY